MEIILLSYLVQIPIALYAAFKAPRRDGMADTLVRARNLTIFLGVVPCGPISIIGQVIYLSMYMAGVKVKDMGAQKHAKAFEQNSSASNVSGGANPFGGSTTPQPTKPAAPETNPFGSGTAGAPASGSDSSSNPFAPPGDADPSAKDSGANPFG